MFSRLRETFGEKIGTRMGWALVCFTAIVFVAILFGFTGCTWFQETTEPEWGDSGAYVPPDYRRTYHLVEEGDVGTVDFSPFQVLFCSPSLSHGDRDALRASGKIILAEIREFPPDDRWHGFLVRHEAFPLVAELRDKYPKHIIIKETTVESYPDSLVNGCWIDLNVDLNHLMVIYRQRRASEEAERKPIFSVINTNDCAGAWRNAKLMRWVYLGHTKGEELCQQP